MPRLREFIFEDAVKNLLVVGELASPPMSVSLEDTLYEVLMKFLQSGYGQIPIEDEKLGVMGILRFEDLMKAYHAKIQTLEEEKNGSSIKFHKKDYILRITPTLALPLKGEGIITKIQVLPLPLWEGIEGRGKLLNVKKFMKRYTSS